MSSLLEEAIVDATALKEAALKNAENLIIEKYSKEVKQSMDALLEQEDPTATAATDEEEELHSVVKKLPDAFSSTGDDAIIIDLDELDSHINEALELNEKKVVMTGDIAVSGSPPEASEGDWPKGDLTEEDLMAEIEALFAEEASGSIESPAPREDDVAAADAADSAVADDAAPAAPSGGLGQDVVADADPTDRPISDMTDDDVANILKSLAGGELAESVKINARPAKSGWLDTPDSHLEEYEDLAMALLHDTEIADDLERIAKLKKKLQKENKLLKDNAKKVLEENGKLRDVVGTLRTKLEEVNVSNAKLLYINQTLESVSLNERQKKQIVEAITRADSVKEAKVIFETLRNSVGSVRKERMPESLSESVTNRSSLLLAARQNNKKNETASPFFDRMQKLAGLKTNN